MTQQDQLGSQGAEDDGGAHRGPAPPVDGGRGGSGPGEGLPTVGELDGRRYRTVADDVTHDEVMRGELGAGDVAPADLAASMATPPWQRPTVRAGIYAWAILGLLVMAVVIAFVIGQVSVVVVPVVLALFPAAVLSPLCDRLKDRGMPRAPAALLTFLLAIAVFTAVISVVVPQFAEQGEVLGEAVTEGYAELEAFLADGPFGLQPVRLDDLVDGISEQVRSSGLGSDAAGSALGFAARLFQTATSTLLMFIVLFFYLKDGDRIADWVRSVFPEPLHDDVAFIGRMGWRTVGGYIQGQLLVAFVDAVFIGVGLWVLGVELALPLSVIVFIGGLFPIIGATVSGVLAALVALATDGPTTALLVIVLVIIVQQVEGNLLQPIIQAKLLSLHPLAIILALTVGGFLLGILGAFLAVPVAAAAAQTVGYLRQRIPG